MQEGISSTPAGAPITPTNLEISARAKEKISYEYKAAETPKERRAVLDFVRRIYRRVGYLPDVETKEQAETFGRCIMSPKTKVISVFSNGKLFGTVSIVPDSELGLSANENFETELLPYKLTGKKIAEVARLTVDDELLPDFNPRAKSLADEYRRLKALGPLLKKIVKYGVHRSLDCLVIEINPKHRRFYEDLGLERISDQKEISLAGTGKTVPAILYVLNLKEPSRQSNFFQIIDMQEAINRPPSPEEIELFD